MGVVYKARHVTSNRMTALKILPLRLSAKTQYLERFKREAMALMRIEHDNVVRAYDFGGSEDYYYLALEFVEGETLDKLLKRETCLPERRALELCLQIARGLGATSGAGLVHRDVKPENVIVTPEGVAKLVDFGIVKLLDDPDEGTVTIAGTTVGTPFYISPEQARGEEELDVRSDLYSLGITLFQLTTGKVPFTGKSQGAILVRHILEEVPDPRAVRHDLSEDLARVVRKLTRKRREDRYASPQEVVDAISQVLAGAGAPAPTPV
ncbi:MAG: serine/threonine protein kinase [Planctomycetes bacterium]|nr:serine/threonine protein kinase [Planctomycetota bacterium]